MYPGCGKDRSCFSKSSGMPSRDFKHGNSVVSFNIFKDHIGYSVENAALKFLCYTALDPITYRDFDKIVLTVITSSFLF